MMAGTVTDVCLMFPALSAVEEGYDVYAVIDASATKVWSWAKFWLTTQLHITM